MNFKLFASDLDGTLIPANNNKICEKSINILHDITSTFYKTAYVTGRHYDYALKGIADSKLPTPNYLICDVGTSLYMHDKESYYLDNNYKDYLGSIWEVGTNLKVIKLLEQVSELELQEKVKQGIFKCSYYLDSKHSKDRVLKFLEETLTNASILYSIIVSKDVLSEKTLIDILPKGVSKVTTINFLIKELNIKDEETIYAGDSGNDLSVFLSNVNSILVANAHSNVITKVKENIEKEKFYIANSECLTGVVEGLQYFLKD